MVQVSVGCLSMSQMASQGKNAAGFQADAMLWWRRSSNQAWFAQFSGDQWVFSQAGFSQ
eukprot:CAMPEP_0169082598 /NCGR_PEP_ID=MMETSP1015-20121227/11631_1 /TAXON_ID=342587 /ORGANISM="Karlodinium micrum, Strain CCMP2283" /LENGTH=58 /DNA_ID=CAMNT_0009142467 /DNA_START=92 /DNA_END=268 /DNA_ORIENTATION=+